MNIEELKKINCVIGIDPGSNGGITIWRKGSLAKAVKMPKTLEELQAYLEYYKDIATPLVFLEKMSVRFSDMDNKGKIFRIQKLMENYANLKATITLSGLPYVLVHPMKWQCGLKLRKIAQGVKEEKSERKKRFRDAAQKLYPEIKATLWNADATLIMQYGRYILESDPHWVVSNIPSSVSRLFFANES